MANEVEPHIWKAAAAATRRYFKTWRVKGTVQTAAQAVSASFYRTGYIMGYRAGQRSPNSGEAKS
jgi:hypothetical protein